MKIEKNKVVTVKYTLSDTLGNVLESDAEPIIYLHGGYEGTLPRIEQTLDGKELGFKEMIQVEPEEAFGDYDAELVRIEDVDKLPTPLEVGMQFEGIPEEDSGEAEDMIFTVTDIVEGKVILDGNHPLAGMALRFDLQVVDVRNATDEEIKNGYANDPDNTMGDAQEDGEYRTYQVH